LRDAPRAADQLAAPASEDDGLADGLRLEAFELVHVRVSQYRLMPRPDCQADVVVIHMKHRVIFSITSVVAALALAPGVGA
jgi:hypothetical protein